MEKRKLLIRSRYLVYGAIFVLLYVLQCMPGFLEIGGVRPMLLIPAAALLWRETWYEAMARYVGAAIYGH